MRRSAFILAAGVLAAAWLTAPAFAGDDTVAPPTISCGNGIPGGVNCILTKKDLKEARSAFTRGLKLEEHQHSQEAFAQFDEASRLMPQNPQFLTARELVRAQLVFNHVERGNALLLEGSRAQAAAEFKIALELDPENQFVLERLAEASRDPEPQAVTVLPSAQDSAEIRLDPTNAVATFHYTGGVHGLFNELSAAYGITLQFDDSVQNHQLIFNVDDADFFTALRLACKVSKTMWVPMAAHQMLIAAETPENHKQLDHMSLRTFVLPPHSTPQEVTDLTNTLRTMFDLRFLTTGQSMNQIDIRAPAPVLEACGKLLEQLSNERPEVMLEIRVYQIDHQLMRNIGMHVPDTFNGYNIPAAALAGLGGQNIQQLINSLISSGGINQAGSSALSGLLAQLSGQANSIFSQPLATFGNGLGFSGVSLDQLTTNLGLNESWVRSLENMSMRASQGTDATFHLGERYPVLNASYAPISNSPQIAAVLGNQTYVPPFPSVSYEDLGLSVKAKPTIHGDGDVNLQLELQVRSLTGQSNNGVPVISNQEYKGNITVKDGEPAVVAGQVSNSEMLSLTGIPGFGAFPGLNKVFVNNTKQTETDELMIIITPHVLANTVRTTPEIWISEK